MTGLPNATEPAADSVVPFPEPADSFVPMDISLMSHRGHWRTISVHFRIALVFMSKTRRELTEAAVNLAKTEPIDDDCSNMLSDTLERLVRNQRALEAAAEISGAAAARLAFVAGRLDELEAIYAAEEESIDEV